MTLSDEKRKELRKDRFTALFFTIVILIVFPLLLIYLKYQKLLPLVGADPKVVKTVFYIFLIYAIGAPLLMPFIEHRMIVARRKSRKLAGRSDGQTYVNLHIQRLAMAATSYIFGAVMFAVSQSEFKFWCFFVIGIFWTVRFWPTETKLERYLEKVESP
ncbi:MAG TPA: hypothetical protein VJ983_07840 [candidate division Zixibacteria bacterium]|nr:hypothetical protein [candidate division Zixibacteria bacterium]